MRGHTVIWEIYACLLLALIPGLAGAQGMQGRAGQSQGAASANLPEPLTSDEAVRIGLERNPQTAAGVAGVASAAASYRSLAAFPTVQLSVTHAQGTSTAPTLNGANSDTFFDVGDTLDTSGQRRFQAAGAKATWAATRYQFDETKLSLMQQIRDAYWSLVAARAQVQIAEESLRDVERVHALTILQEQAGAAPHVDVVRSSIDVANGQQALVTAQAGERTALAAFNVLLARPPLATVKPSDNLAETTVAPTLLPALPDVPELIRIALASRPDVLAAREQVHVAEYTLKQNKASRLPDVSLDYERSVQQNPSDTVLVGIHMPLLDFGSIGQSIKSADQARKQADAQAKQTEQQVEQQVAQAHTDFLQAQKLVASYQADIVAPSVKLLDMAQLGYKQGATGILPVIDAETTLRNARTGYISALLSLYKAQDEILAATGGLITPAAPTRK